MINVVNQVFPTLALNNSFLSHTLDYFLGVIRNTRVLNYSESHSYVLSIVAEDCGLTKSKPLLVTVEVKQACNTGWTGIILNSFV